jgi:hypothetical protein
MTHDDTCAHFQAWLENKDPKLVQSVYGSLFKEVIVQPHDLNTSYERDFGSFGGGLAGKPVRSVLNKPAFVQVCLSTPPSILTLRNATPVYASNGTES